MPLINAVIGNVICQIDELSISESKDLSDNKMNKLVIRIDNSKRQISKPSINIKNSKIKYIKTNGDRIIYENMTCSGDIKTIGIWLIVEFFEIK